MPPLPRPWICEVEMDSRSFPPGEFLAHIHGKTIPLDVIEIGMFPDRNILAGPIDESGQPHHDSDTFGMKQVDHFPGIGVPVGIPDEVVVGGGPGAVDQHDSHGDIP